MRLLSIDNEIVELAETRLKKGGLEEAKKNDVFAAYLDICDKRFVRPRDRRVFFRQLRQLLGPGYREEKRRRSGGRERWLVGIGLQDKGGNQ